MVRYCVVSDCIHSDLTTLTHRFPKNLDKWRESLNLMHISANELKKYTVCCNHFKISDYRHKASNFLNVTAVPQIFVPEAERRTSRVEEGNPDAENDPQDHQEIFIELESGDKLEYQTMTLGLDRNTPESPEKDEPMEKRQKLTPVKIDLILEEDEEQEDDPKEVIKDQEEEEPLLKSIPLPEDDSQDEIQLREHYANYTKEQLIDFLVKLRVFLK